MADKKISELTTLSSGDLSSTDDEMPVVDSSSGQTKKITPDALFDAVGDARYLQSVPAEYLTETEGDLRYLQTVPAEYLTETEGDAKYLQSVPAEYLTETEGDAKYLQAVPAEYLTETESDAKYLQSVPAEYLTETEGDAKYLQTVPAEYLTETEGDAKYLQTVPAEYLTETEGDVRYAQLVGTNDFTGGDMTLTDTGDVFLTIKSTGTGDADARLNLDGADTGESTVMFRNDGTDKANVNWSEETGQLNITTEAGTNAEIDIQPNNKLVSRHYVHGATGGRLVSFYNDDGTTCGHIGAQDTDMWIGEGEVGLQFQITGSDRIDPFDTDANAARDNGIDLGGASSRFDDVYATNGTIQTSDLEQKTDVEELSEAEARVAVACKGLLRKFRWKDSKETKGEDARWHFGIIAQELEAAFTAEGLDAGDYGMFIVGTSVDEAGAIQYSYGVRYTELLAFIIAAL